MEKNTKEKILDSLNNEFIVTKAEKRYGGSELEIYAEFIYNGRKGIFIYTLIGREIGVDETFGFAEQEGEDLYQEIHDWMEKHIKSKTKVFLDNQEI